MLNVIRFTFKVSKINFFISKVPFFYLSFILIISSNSYSAEPNAEAFVLKLTNEAKLIFNDKSLNVEARLKKLNNLSQSYLDLDALAGYTLGDYRDKATASEKDNFNKLFKDSEYSDGIGRFDNAPVISLKYSSTK